MKIRWLSIFGVGIGARVVYAETGAEIIIIIAGAAGEGVVEGAPLN
jgi:hypothetical protein